MKYILDTNICIYLMKNKSPVLQKRIESEELFKISISANTLVELEYGMANSRDPDRNRGTLYNVLAPFEIISFTEQDTELFGIIRAYLKKAETPIGPYWV